jgi:hypothetical protein
MEWPGKVAGKVARARLQAEIRQNRQGIYVSPFRDQKTDLCVEGNAVQLCSP